MSIGILLGQALRMAQRDWRGGELRLLAVALVIAVAAVASVGFVVDRVRSGLQRDAAQYLGGDAVLDSDHPINDGMMQGAARLGLRSALTATFPSMAMAETGTQAGTLVAVKAVTDGYPLRGSLQLIEGAARRTASGIPASGTVWVEAQVLDALGVQQGDVLRLGNSRLRIAAVIAAEPDRAVQVLGFAPRLLINAADLPATGLIQPASRVTYRWLIAGERAPLRALLSLLQPKLERGQHLESLEDGRPEMQRTLARADRYMSLVALLTVMISSVAVSTAARRFAARRLDSCALMRCLGLAQNEILVLFCLEFALVGLLASLVGVACGLALHFVLVDLLAGLVQAALPWPSPYPGLQGVLCGLVLLLGFAIPPLEQLRRVSPVRVLRRDVGARTVRAWLAYVAGALGFVVLLLWTAGEARLGLIVGGGFLACVALFGAIARAAMQALQALRRRESQSIGVAWRFALAAMQRRPGASLAQVVALAVGLMALLVLAIARTDLVEEWRAQVPANAPNRFVINIQPDQVDAVAARLRAAHIAEAPLEPMVRGRLIEINGKRVGPEDFEDARARALIDREFNLSYRTDPPAHNRIAQGHWFAPDAPELSIEDGIAKRLGIVLGQVLRFDVAGQMVEAKVTSIRTLSWDSMRVNFFVIMAPSLLRQAPQTFITSFYLPEQQTRMVTELVREFPNLTIIDTAQVLGQVRGMLDQVIGAAQFLFGFALAAGMLVLYTALASSHDERVREAALLRALGASRRQLARAQTAEMILVGALSGALAAIGAGAVGWALAHFVFEFDFVAHAWVPLVGIAGGIVSALLGGWAGMRTILETPPLTSLREA
ncbi:putative ABC-type transport system involved in lysophospholipase L1 biosynthesis, permease component [Burkholderiales bacterium]|nr:putative ABC-type transport system involved in lysophospholipase L1 biosynthesis, permease component [Burkholderiales bacterium]